MNYRSKQIKLNCHLFQLEPLKVVDWFKVGDAPIADQQDVEKMLRENIEILRII